HAVRPLSVHTRPHHPVAISLRLRRQFPYRWDFFTDGPSSQEDVFIHVIRDLHINGFFTFKLHIKPLFRVIYDRTPPKAGPKPRWKGPTANTAILEYRLDRSLHHPLKTMASMAAVVPAGYPAETTRYTTSRSPPNRLIPTIAVSTQSSTQRSS